MNNSFHIYRDRYILYQSFVKIKITYVTKSKNSEGIHQCYEKQHAKLFRTLIALAAFT